MQRLLQRYWHVAGRTMAGKKGRNSSVTGMERGHGKYGVK